MTINSVKSKLYDHKGELVTIKCNLGRNKYEKYNAKIRELYNNIFTVEIEKYNIIKSFSYSDILTKVIKIDY